MPKQCPVCKITCEDYVKKCECGYDFTTKSISEEDAGNYAAKNMSWTTRHVISCVVAVVISLFTGGISSPVLKYGIAIISIVISELILYFILKDRALNSCENKRGK